MVKCVTYNVEREQQEANDPYNWNMRSNTFIRAERKH